MTSSDLHAAWQCISGCDERESNLVEIGRLYELNDSDDGESTDDEIEDSDKDGEDDSEKDNSDDNDVDEDGDTDE